MCALEPSQRSKFLVGQMTQWVAALSEEGRSEDLFELEMWLRSLERYFRLGHAPLPEDSPGSVAIRSFCEEVGLVVRVIRRVNQLCTCLSSGDRVNQERFEKYVENFIREGDIVDPYVARLLRQKTPQAGLALLRESFEDVQIVLGELTKLSRIPHATFWSIGRLIYREIRKNDYLSLLMDQKFKPAYDRVGSEPIAELIRAIDDKETLRQAASIFLELFRLLHYLEFADPRRQRPEEIRTTALVFSLVATDTRRLIDYLSRLLARNVLSPPLGQTLEKFVYCIPLELRKVMETELADIASFKKPEAILSAVENSHGILRDCFQQCVVQLAQVFDPQIDGPSVFAHYATELEQSLTVRRDLMGLVRVVGQFSQTGDPRLGTRMKQMVAQFRDRSLRYLYYRDWANFETFNAELAKCESPTGLLQIARRFEAHLLSLVRDVGRRSVFQGEVSDTQPKAAV